MRKLHCLLVGVLLLISDGLLAQTATVSGKVTDVSGAPIPNATIRIKSNKSTSGTSADGQGAFSIKVSPNAELIVSAVGYETKQVNVGTTAVLNIMLNTDTRSL